MTDTALQTPNRRPAVLAMVLVVLTLAVFGRCVMFDFVDWDDLDLVVQNPILNPVTWQHLVQAWTAPVKNLYTPMAYSVWAMVSLVAQTPTADMFGGHLNPMIFHALNVLLHAGAVVLVFSILRSLFRKLEPAIIGAAVFAFHPLQVEPVSWISGMNNVLAGLFVLAAIAAYIQFATSTRRRLLWYALAMAALLLGLFSKPTAIVAPLFLLLIDGLILRRLWKKAFAGAVPFCMLAFPFVLIGRMAQSADVIVSPPFDQRVKIMIDTIGFYLAKVAWPYPLLFDYSRTPQWVADHGVSIASIVALCVAGAIVLVAAGMRRWNIVAAIAIFITGVLPVSGITPFSYQYYSTVSDRYAYLSLFGIAILAAAVIDRLPRWGTIALAVLVLGWMGICFNQTGVWADTQTLATYTLDHNTQSFAAHDMLAEVARHANDVQSAEQHLRAALQIRPDEYGCNLHMGNLLLLQYHRPADAIAYYNRAIQWGYTEADIMFNIGTAYFQVGQVPEAITALTKSLEREPNNAKALATLGYALASESKFAEAEQNFRKALAIDPNSPLAKMGLQRVLAAEAAGPQGGK